jgi:cytochrome c-type biogenesis protein CcmH
MAMDAFLVAARDRLQKLKQRHDAGTLGAKQYEAERRAIEQDIADRLLAGSAPAAARPSHRLVASLAALVLAVAAAGYWATGSPSLAGVGPGAGSAATTTAAAPHDLSASGPDGAKQIAAMVDALAARLKEHPDDAQGWAMLARTYTVLGRLDEAVPAYRRATELLPGNASLLADYADVVAATKGGVDNPESVALIERSLAADPKHPKALALAGTLAFDRGDFAGAVKHWQGVVDQLPPESELTKQVQASIVEARQRAGGAGATVAATAPPTGATSGPVAAAAPAAGKSVSGTVTLAPALAGKAAPDDTVFVAARVAGGSRMPLAVQRARVADLPLSFKLDDAMAMSPSMTISSASQIIVSARITKSGNAIPQNGDLTGETAAVAPGATGIAIRIDSVVGSR